MITLRRSLLGASRSFLRRQRDLALENLALRHQIGVLKLTVGKRRLRLGRVDRVLWAGLSRIWVGWEQALAIVQPATVIRWRREGFKRYWTRKSRAGLGGRPPLAREVRDLIRRMSRSNPTWGTPRIRSELAKFGIELSRATVAKYMIRHRKPPSPTWRAFLDNHLKDLLSIDFFVVPTATFRVLFGFLVLAHDRRRVVHFNVTSSPSAEWTAQQIVQAFPEESAPRYLLRDRDGTYGKCFRRRVRDLGIKEVLIAARSPWQSPYVERLIGSLRRDCLDHVIILNEQHLRRVLRRYFSYYHRTRCHLSLDGDAPKPRAVQGPELGKVIELPEVGGLHHRYVRPAAGVVVGVEGGRLEERRVRCQSQPRRRSHHDPSAGSVAWSPAGTSARCGSRSMPPTGCWSR
jgi:putative transposase